MRVHLQRDIEKLKRRLLVLSTEVEEDVRLAVRALAERLGCTVALRSRPGRGSVFRVTLRVQDPSRPFMRA